MTLQTTQMWLNAVAVLIVGVAPVPTPVHMSTPMTDPAFGDRDQSAAVLDDERLGAGAESTFPCTTGDASADCEQFMSLRTLDADAYAAEYADCDCDILVVLCRLTNTFTDFINVIDDDGNVISSETIRSCEYGGCGVEIDLE